jgi:chaperonin GroES
MIKAPEDIVIIKKEKKTEPEQTKSGLFLSSLGDEDNKNTGIVVAVGEGRQLRSGVRAPMDVKIGDKIMYNPGGVMTFKHGEDEYLSLFSASVLAILEGEEDE